VTLEIKAPISLNMDHKFRFGHRKSMLLTLLAPFIPKSASEVEGGSRFFPAALLADLRI
jgi:hypothetical protein